MSSNRTVLLSKSRFLAGLQCLKRLYLDCHHRELADPVSSSQQSIFDTGHTVGDLARRRFPGGTLVSEQYFEHAQAEYRTQALLRDESVPALYEPAFSFAGIRTRVDVLLRTSGRAFDLIEVKSTASAKDEHIPDVSIQMHVVEGCGIPVGRAYLMHLNTGYVYQGGDHDLTQLFSLRDVTDEVREYAEEQMTDELIQMWEALRDVDTLNVDTGRQCFRPYPCPFFGHCHQQESEHPIRQLPGLSLRLEERLRAHGTTAVASIPLDFPGLSWLQRRVRESVVTDRPFMGEELGEALAEIKHPASFLDFEALSPPIPIYVGTRPFQTVPFQWSLHVRGADGRLRHHAFLGEGFEDPREELIVSLLEAIPDRGTIVAYSNYERTVLRGLALAFPQYEEQLLEQSDRIVDLHRIVRGQYYHPEMHGSFSIKSVLPVLVPGLDYGDLEIAEGRAAAAAFSRSIADATPREERARIRESLLAYCERDTEAMVGVYEALLREARQTGACSSQGHNPDQRGENTKQRTTSDRYE